MEKKALFDFIKNKVKEYYKNMAKRLIKDENGIESNKREIKFKKALGIIEKKDNKKNIKMQQDYISNIPDVKFSKRLISIKKFILIIPRN